MQQTPIYGLRSPDDWQSPDGPLAVENLARDTENALFAIENTQRKIWRPEVVVLRKSGNQAVANNTYVDMTWQIEDQDPDELHSTGSSTDRVTPTRTGWYYAAACLQYSPANPAAGDRRCYITKNADASTVPTVGIYTNGGNSTLFVRAQALVEITTLGDYIGVKAYQNSGQTLQVGGWETTGEGVLWQSYFEVTYIRPLIT